MLIGFIIWSGGGKKTVEYIVILDHEWLQFDLGPPTMITGLITRGQGDKKRYVTSYTMSYSNDTSNWHFYKDANHLESKVRQITVQGCRILPKLVNDREFEILEKFKSMIYRLELVAMQF